MNKTLNLFFMISIIGLAVSALIFILIAIFSDKDKQEMIVIGLLCCILSNLFNILRSILSKSKH